MMSEKWMRCKVANGMFSDEVVITIKVHGGEAASFFVPRDKVQGDGDHNGKVKVRSYNDDSGVWAVVPNDQQTLVPVDSTELVGA
jgi:hypothetical protein